MKRLKWVQMCGRNGSFWCLPTSKTRVGMCMCVCVRPNVVNIEIKVGHQKVYTKIMDCIRPAFVHHFCVVGWGERERESSEAWCCTTIHLQSIAFVRIVYNLFLLFLSHSFSHFVAVSVSTIIVCLSRSQSKWMG